VVLIEGVGLDGVTIELTGPQTRTTTPDASGQYAFLEVPSGAYVVSVRNAPDDASFPATSKTAVVSGNGPVTVDFLGNYIRTASIEGTVKSGLQGVPGVTVELRGTESRSAVTGAGGSFLFTSLRAGSYEVEISNLPTSVTFPSVLTNVNLSIGQRALVTFQGVPEITASVVIRSVTRRAPDGSVVSVDLQNVRGQIEVTLTVDRGEDTVERVELLLGDEVVGTQRFGPGPSGGVEGPDGAAPFDLIFGVNTADFDSETGDARFLNGMRLLTARLATLEGGPSAWLASVQVQLRNVNTFTGSVTASKGTVLGDDGQTWTGGDLSVLVRPVLFDTSRAVTAVTVDVRRTAGPQVRVSSGTGTPPFSITFDGDGTPAPSNVADYQTPAGATDEVRVAAAAYGDGSAVAGVPAVLAEGLRLDNVAPPTPVFALPTQGAETDCCLGNWVGAGFLFESALALVPDAGVGGAEATVHAGPATLTDEELLARQPVLLGSDLAATTVNTELRAVANVGDALGNTRTLALAPSTGNPLGGPLGAVFGVDLALPLVAFGAGSVANRAVNPEPGAAWVLEGTDVRSGFGTLPARARVRLFRPGVTGTPAACPFPGTAACLPAPDGLVKAVPEGAEGYLVWEGRLLDRAGNRSATVSRVVVRDETAPAVESMQVPGSLEPGGETTISAILSDGLDLHRGWTSLVFTPEGGGTAEALPFAPPVGFGAPFDEDLVNSGAVSQTFPLSIGLEEVNAGPSPNEPSGAPRRLSHARAVARDVGGNLGSRAEPLAGVGAFVLRSFSVTARGNAEGVRDWKVEADADEVCVADADCGDDVPASVRLRATASGLGGSFERPFDRVYFHVILDGEPEFIGVTAAATSVDAPGPLGGQWSWEIDWGPGVHVPAGPVQITATGVELEGNALRTRPLGSVTVVGAP
jgi:hypothetical protein